MAHHVIYLPGVGDHGNAKIQINALRKWKKYDLETHFHHINWNTDESYRSKLDAILKIIDELHSIDGPVSLVGVSAGASMAVNAYVLRKNRVSAVVFVCGKINNPQTLGDDYKTRNPRLFESVSVSAKSTQELTKSDKEKMLTIQPIFDGVVAKADGRIDGIKHKTLFSFLHAISIYLSITFFKKITINFIKSKIVQ
jgi:pimeloyl-ACP methyl ester carboxylesterase